MHCEVTKKTNDQQLKRKQKQKETVSDDSRNIGTKTKYTKTQKRT